MPAQVQVRPEEIKPLKAADPAELSKELGIVDPTTLTPMGVVEEADPELVKQAAEYADKLVSFSRGNIDAETSSKMAVEQMGRSLQNDAAKKSQMLLQPVKNLYSAGTEGSEVGKSLIQLRETVESLDPHKFDFEAGWGTRLVGLIPGVGTPIKRYFMRYESAETMIDSIVRSLDLGREQLYRDIVTLTGDQKDMRILTQKLEKTVKLGILIKRNLELKVAELSEGDERAAFIKDELLFPLSQRVQDLQQQLIVNQQGVLAMGIVIKNNIELIRGIYRAKDVTITALRVAVAVALALNNQRLQLQKIQQKNAHGPSLRQLVHIMDSGFVVRH